MSGKKEKKEDSKENGEENRKMKKEKEGWKGEKGKEKKKNEMKRLYHNSPFAYTKWCALGFIAKEDFTDRKCALYATTA